jgi:hypothetical protein
VKYSGSGKYWKHHVKVHGKEHIETLWYCLFLERDELVKFALMCSEQWDIVNSDIWLNLKPENGIDGGNVMNGKRHSIESRYKMSQSRKGKVQSIETIRKRTISLTGKIRSDETKTKISIALRNPSIETRAKIGIAHKNKIVSPDSKAKMSLSHKGKVTSIETKEKLAAAQKGKKKVLVK